MNRSINSVKAILKRELSSYFHSPTAYVVLVVFLILQGFFTFYVGGFYESGQAELSLFFTWHPWIFLFLAPAITMRLFSDEKRTGTIELLMTLPVTPLEIVIAKFFSAWIFISIGIILTFPIVITSAYLGNPDMGAVISGYLGSLLMAGALISIGCFSSSITKSQVIAFLLALSFSLFLILSGHSPVIQAVSEIAPGFIVNFISGMSILTHFKTMTKGIIDLRDLLYFVSIMVFMLYLNTSIINSNSR
ncbi:MAG: ABC transporter permease subunit [Desulforegulaceae bacterium]|nr:ABC transporter permease subunit [Desulforegulaceae bacterium]